MGRGRSCPLGRLGQQLPQPVGQVGGGELIAWRVVGAVPRRQQNASGQPEHYFQRREPPVQRADIDFELDRLRSDLPHARRSRARRPRENRPRPPPETAASPHRADHAQPGIVVSPPRTAHDELQRPQHRPARKTILIHSKSFEMKSALISNVSRLAGAMQHRHSHRHTPCAASLNRRPTSPKSAASATAMV